MYAKLRFKNGTVGAVFNRTVVRAITDCYDGIGPATFDGYEGLDSAHCVFYSKDSSHWTFAGETDLGTSDINSTSAEAWHGAAYSLKCTYDTGHTAYTDVLLRGNYTSSAVYDVPQAHMYFCSRNRVNTAIEDRQWGNFSMTNPWDADIRGCGVSPYFNREIHIMADQTKLCLFGSNNQNIAEREALMHFNFNQPSQMKWRDKINPIADSNVPTCVAFITNGSGAVGTDVYIRDTGSWSSTWDNSGQKAPLIFFPGNIYNERTGDKIRNCGVHGADDMTAAGVVYDDDVTARPTNGTPNPFLTYYNSYQQFKGYQGKDWGGAWGFDTEAWDAVNGNAFDIDSNGDKSIRLHPYIFDWAPLGGNEVNMSEKAGIYFTCGNAGFFGDSADIDGVKYQYFPLSDVQAIMVRRD